MPKCPFASHRYSHILLISWGLAAALFWSAELQAAEATLAWAPIRQPDALLYRIYHREAGGQFDFAAPLWEGAATTCTLTGLADGTTHHFVGRSVDASGATSRLSNEIVFHAPPVSADLPVVTPESPPVDAEPLPEPPPPASEVAVRVLFDADNTGETGTRWSVLDDAPPGAQVTKVYDPLRQSRVADLVGDWINNSFQLNAIDGGLLAERGPWRLVWEMQAELYYFVAVVLETSAGVRTLFYTPSNFDLLGNGPSVHHGLGLGSVDSGWHTHDRHLDDDLLRAQPEVAIEGLRAIHIRGRVQVDDIHLVPVP